MLRKWIEILDNRKASKSIKALHVTANIATKPTPLGSSSKICTTTLNGIIRRVSQSAIPTRIVKSLRLLATSAKGATKYPHKAKFKILELEIQCSEMVNYQEEPKIANKNLMWGSKKQITS
jgi:hypothetical protein